MQVCVLHAAQLLFDLLPSHPFVLLHQTPGGQKDAINCCLQQNLQRHLRANWHPQTLCTVFCF